MVAEVTHRVFFQPSGIDANPASPSFCLDFWTYRYVSKPLPAAKGGGFSKPARSARVTLYKAARSKIVRMWTGKDEDGIGKSARATLDDVLVTETFERCVYR